MVGGVRLKEGSEKMHVLKNHFKLVVGIAVILLTVMAFFIFMKHGDLENAELRSWISASESRKIATVKILSGGEEDVDVIVQCISKMAAMPDAGRMKIRDAASLCAVGIALNKNKEE